MTRDDDSPTNGFREPSLQELLEDPVVGRMMACDGVDPDHLMGKIARIRRALSLAKAFRGGPVSGG